MNAYFLQKQSSAMGYPMDDNLLEEKWGHLVDSHFGELTRDVTTMVTTQDMEGKDVIDEALLEELGWAISRKKFEALVQGLNKPHLPNRILRSTYSFACRNCCRSKITNLAGPQRVQLVYIR